MSSVDIRSLVEAMEYAECMTPHVPGHCEYATIAGVLTCLTPTDDPISNKAMLARLDAHRADDAIGEVRRFFGEKHKPFSWIVGPNSTPSDLGDRLKARGFQLFMTADGMYYPDLKMKLDPDPAVRITELSVHNPGPAVEVMARGFNMSLEAAIKLHETLALCADALHPRIYAAYVEGVETPVACGYLSRFPDRPIAVMCGGATLPEYRGRGLYKALLARRLAAVAEDGLSQAIVLADQRTSAPICARSGFVKVCEVQMYVWRPGESSPSS